MALFNKSSKTSPAAAAKAAPAPAPKASAAPAPAAKAAPTKAAAPAAKPVVDAAERQRMIGEAAYYLAEKRGFAHGHHDADWAAAEKQIDAMLAKRK